MLPDEKIGCHRLPRKCRDGVINEHCQLWVRLQGVNPQTGQPIDHYACADAIVPYLLIENSKEQRQTAAAVESFRNEVVKAGEAADQMRREALTAFVKSGGPLIDVK